MRDGGHAAVEFALAVGVLLLPAALFILSLGPWLEQRVAARAVAAEAARAAAIDLDLGSGSAIASRVVASHGVVPERARLGWCGAVPTEIGAPSGSCPMSRGSVIVADVELWVPLITTPWGEVGGIWAAASHAEAVDLYRSIP